VVEPRTLASRLPRTPPFSRLLQHAGGYSRTILTPNLQGLDAPYPPLYADAKEMKSLKLHTHGCLVAT